MKRPYNGACLKQHPFVGADPVVLLGNHRGARGRSEFGHWTQDRKYPIAMDLISIRFMINSTHRTLWCIPVHHRTHPRIRWSILLDSITCQTSKGMAAFFKQVIFTIKTSPRFSLQRTKIKTLGYPGRVLNGGIEWTLSFIQSRTLLPIIASSRPFLHPHNQSLVNAVRHPPRFEVPTRQPDLDDLYGKGVHLDYMDSDPGESNPKPRGLHHHSTNMGTQPQTTSSQAKHTTP